VCILVAHGNLAYDAALGDAGAARCPAVKELTWLINHSLVSSLGTPDLSLLLSQP